MDKLEDLQVLAELTHKQSLAFKRLERAFKACEKEEVFLHQALGSITGINGRNVMGIDIDGSPYDDLNINNFLLPTIRTKLNPHADDTHSLIFGD